MIIKLFFILLATCLLFANSEYKQKYEQAKTNYINAVFNDSKKNEIKSLKQLIIYGNKLKIETSKYTKELKSLVNDSKSKVNIKKLFQNTSGKNTINSVTVVDNRIIISFRHKISSRYIKFYEDEKGKFKRDNFDIVGIYKEANKLKLRMPKVSDVEKIIIFTKKQKKIQVSLLGNKNLETIYIIENKKIIIKVLSKLTSQVKAKFSNYKLKNNTKQKIIVLDPGHGGKDKGAIGPNKRFEKTSVLNVSRKLFSILKSRGYKVYTTRNRDVYKPLKYRTKFANEKKADLFISIHANAVSKKKAKKIYGIETYYLSPARSERAKRVAAIENKADIKSMGFDTKNIFLMTRNRAKITASNKLALDVQNNILHNLRKKYKLIKDNGVRKGPFWILVGAQMPAILIEVGFISHPIESKRLYSSSYQYQIANGIANGIDSYFTKNP